jgi:Na+-transporting NADH:ubiquinone oxidoreductase subunit F
MMLMGGALAILLVIAERFLADYGDCKIDINGKKEITVKGGSSLLSSLNSKKIFLASACGGRGSCGFCKCRIMEGGGPLLPTEKPFLNQKEIDDNFRLSCQVKVKQDIRISIPESVFNISQFKAKVIDIKDLTYDIKELTLILLEPETISFKAGQYLQLQTNNYDRVRHSVSRAYSISSNPSQKNTLQLIIRKVPEGLCTTWVHEYLRSGDIVEFTGPYGDFYIRDSENDILFVAGGSGMAPIKSMLEWLDQIKSKRTMAFYFGARTLADLYYTTFMTEFEDKIADFKYYPVLSQPEENDNWQGKTGFVTPYLKDFIKDAASTEAYLCGSPGMINAIKKGLLEYGIKEEMIFYDSFS